MKIKILFLFVILSQTVFSQWELVNKPEGYNITLAYDAIDSLIIFTASKNGSKLRVSKNYGKDWLEFSHPGFDCLTITSTHKIWGCTSNGNIFYSENYGESWTLQYDDEQDTFLNYIKFFDDNNGVCVGDSPDSSSAVLVLRTSDGGANWESVNDSMGIGDISYNIYDPICFPSKDVGYFDIAKSDQLNKTTDGGLTWTELDFPDHSVRIMDFINNDIGYVFSVGDPFYLNIYKTEDGGLSWQKKSSFTTFKFPIGLEVLPESHNHIYFTDYDNLYYSGDNGETSEIIDLGTSEKTHLKK